MKRRITMLLLVFTVLLSVLCIPASANSPPGGNPEQDSIIAFFIYCFFVFGSIMITMATETLLSLVFPHCVKYMGMVLLTNLCSQILMHTLYGLLVSPWAQPIVITIMLEVLVYVGEYLIYRRRMKTAPKLEILIYTISANTLSLLTGLWALRVVVG